jgi:integrase
MRKDAKPPRRPKGDGALFWSEARRCYVGRVIVGRRPDGSPKYREASGPTKAVVRARLADAGARLPDDAPTVSEWLDRWLASLDVRPLTADGYRASAEKRIRPALGGYQLTALTAFDVERAAKVWGGQVGANTVRLTLSHLSVALNAAVRARLLPANPVASARKPRGVKPDIDPYTAAELKRVVAAGCANPRWAALACLAATGLRRGECVALDVPDLDLAAGTLSVTKGDQGRHGIGKPKSPHSVRTLELHPAALPALKKAAGKRKSGPLFLSDAGTRITDDGLATRLRACCAELEIPYRSLHALRHGLAMALDEAGMSLGDLAAWLGDLPATVARRYLHQSKGKPTGALRKVFG